MTDSRIHVGDLKPGDVALLKQVADEAASSAVRRTLIAIGINPDDPIKAQADMQFLRSTRERCEDAGFKAFLTVVSLLVAGAAAAFWAGFKISLK